MPSFESHRWSVTSRRSDEAAEAARREALAWLAADDRENGGTEVVLRRVPETGGALALAREEGALVGAAVSTGPSLYLEPGDEESLRGLLDTLGLGARRTWVRSGAADWLDAWCEEHGGAVRAQDLIVLRVTAPPEVETDGARWAQPGDVRWLEAYARAYTAERGATPTRDWPSAIARREVAVLEHEGRLCAVVLFSGRTRRVAFLGGTWTDPELRHLGLGRRVTAFLVRALLESRPAVQLVVDDDNQAAIALYRTLGFEPFGGVHLVHGRSD